MRSLDRAVLFLLLMSFGVAGIPPLEFAAEYAQASSGAAHRGRGLGIIPGSEYPDWLLTVQDSDSTLRR